MTHLSNDAGPPDSEPSSRVENPVSVVGWGGAARDSAGAISESETTAAAALQARSTRRPGLTTSNLFLLGHGHIPTVSSWLDWRAPEPRLDSTNQQMSIV